jgi:hypothetical protein
MKIKTTKTNKQTKTKQQKQTNKQANKNKTKQKQTNKQQHKKPTFLPSDLCENSEIYISELNMLFP